MTSIQLAVTDNDRRVIAQALTQSSSGNVLHGVRKSEIVQVWLDIMLEVQIPALWELTSTRTSAPTEPSAVGFFTVNIATALVTDPATLVTTTW